MLQRFDRPVHNLLAWLGFQNHCNVNAPFVASLILSIRFSPSLFASTISRESIALVQSSQPTPQQPANIQA